MQNTSLGVLSRFLRNKLSTCVEVFQQQNQLLHQKSRSLPGRILSLSQPHVRAIYRGKAASGYEFGAKISLGLTGDGFAFLDRMDWNPYNECHDLPGQIQAYERRFGTLPEVVCADQIDRTRDNRNFCKTLGIRLSGKPLGRPKNEPDQEITKQMIADERTRNAVG